MKALSKVILALCVTLFLTAPPGTGQTAGDPEIRQILAAAKKFAGSSDAVNKSELKFVRKLKNYALVFITPKPKYKGQWEGAGIILKKIGGKWVGQDMGTDLYEWEQKIPELFK